MDRIDIHIEVPAVRYPELSGNENQGESSGVICQRVERARLIQTERFKPAGFYSNSEMTGKWIKKYCEICPDSAKLLGDSVERLGFSARAYTKVLKVARTIADLAESERILPQHISEAISLRILDRKFDF